MLLQLIFLRKINNHRHITQHNIKIWNLFLHLIPATELTRTYTAKKITIKEKCHLKENIHNSYYQLSLKYAINMPGHHRLLRYTL